MRKKSILAILAGAILLGTRCAPLEQREDYLDENAALAWSYQTGGAIHQPPLLAGGLLILAPSGGPLLALDSNTGELRWQFNPQPGVWDRAYASDGERVFVGLKDGSLAALALDSGEVRWRQALGINVQAPPLAHGDTVYVPTTFVGPELAPDTQGRAKLFALSAESGNLIWAFETGNYILQTPERNGDTIYVGGNFYDPRKIEEGGHVRFYALDAGSGSARWTYESDDGFPKRLYATDRTLVFVGYQDFVNGIDVETGQLKWRVDTGNWTPSLLGADGRVYFGSANTAVFALDADSGEIVWQYDIPIGTFNYLLGAPVKVEDTLYFLTQHGDIFALNADSGELRWQISTGSAAARTGLTVAGGWLFFGDDDGNVYAYR